MCRGCFAFPCDRAAGLTAAGTVDNKNTRQHSATTSRAGSPAAPHACLHANQAESFYTHYPQTANAPTGKQVGLQGKQVLLGKKEFPPPHL